MKIALLVSDLRRSRRFYADLGFRVTERHADGLTVSLGDSALELRSDAEAAAGPHYFTPEIERFPRGTGVELTIETDSLAQIRDLALARDADFVPPLDTDAIDRVQILLSDPDGYLLRFVRPAAARRRTLPGMARAD